MRPLNLIAQTSLDGFVAGINGGFDNFIGDEENLGFVCSIIEDSDAALMGRISFALLEADWVTAADKPGATPNMIKYAGWYNSIPRIVVSKTLMIRSSPNVSIIKEDILSEINKLKQKPGNAISIFGSPTLVHTLLESDLIDNIWLIVHPVLFGEGIPLFRETKKVSKLRLLTSKQLSNETLCHKYSILKSSPIG